MPLNPNNPNASFPSQIVQVNVEWKGASYVINIPKIEVPRITMILKNNEYSLMDSKNNNRPLTILDVGANVGVFAIYGKILNPANIIHCFELSPTTLELLRLNVGHIPGIHIHPFGLGNFEGEVFLNVHPYNTGEDSLRFQYKNNAENRIVSNRVIVKVMNAAKEFDKLCVDHIDVLKIDTEGCEVDILESLDYRLNMIDYVILEYHSEADRRKIDNILSEFHVYGLNAGGLGQGTVKYINNRLING